MLNWRARTHRARGQRGGSDCLICTKPVAPGSPSFMVQHKLWSVELGLPYRGAAHLECVEEKLQRPLTEDDFTKAPINWWVFPTFKIRDGWVEVPKLTGTTAKPYRRRLIKTEGTKDIVTMSLTESGRWELWYFSKALPGRYAALHLGFRSAKRLSRDRAIDWAEDLLNAYPPI